MISLILAIVANAFGRRFAGGLLSQWVGPIGGTQVARGVQALIAGLTVLVLAPQQAWALAGAVLVLAPQHAWALAGAVFVGTFIGATFGFYGPDGMLPKDPAEPGMMLHGILAVAPIVVLWIAAAWLAGGAAPIATVMALLLAGLLRAPAYWVAQRWTPHCPALGLINLRKQGGPIDPPPFAEFISGGLLGAALWTVVLA